MMFCIQGCVKFLIFLLQEIRTLEVLSDTQRIGENRAYATVLIRCSGNIAKGCEYCGNQIENQFYIKIPKCISIWFSLVLNLSWSTASITKHN